MSERDISYTIEGGRICISLYRLFYQKEAVLAAAQKMTGDYYVEIKSLDSKRAGIYLEPKTKGSQESLVSTFEDVAKTFGNQVIDQQVRLDLEKRYGKLRELIVRQAFSPVTVDQLSGEFEKDLDRE